ncbi:MAG: hypothetical protein IT454_10965 [Planctomycetes bacterium]|nr:hypothetical protein [Planctomycetota bacterium]
MPSLHTLYVALALIGSVLMIIQVVLALIGGDSPGDITPEAHDFHVESADAAHDGAHGPGGLSFRTVVAFVSFFGVGGWIATDAGLSNVASLAIALVAGSFAFWIAGLVLTQMFRLRSEGNVDIKNALGAQARVYLAVPAEKSGTGTVTVPIQGRTMQFKAITRGREIKTGALCKVVSVASSDTLEVESL